MFLPRRVPVRRVLVKQACARAAALVDEAARRGGNPLRLVISEGRRAVRAAIARYRDGGTITDDGLAAWLVVSLAQLPVRDDAWARMEPEHRDAHRRLWTDLARGAADAWVPAPAALLAFTAWQCGEGRSPASRSTARWPATLVTRWRCCCARSSTRGCRRRRRGCR